MTESLDDIPINEEEVLHMFGADEFMDLLEKYEGQSITIRCPICGWEQVADRAYYEIGKRHIGHPYTCGGIDGNWHDNVEMEAVSDPD